MTSGEWIRNLRLLKEEDFIWLIYFFIVLFALIANSFEEKYIFTQNKKFQKNGRYINITLLIVALIIYLYYVSIAIEDIYLNKNKSLKKQRVNFERLITTLVFLVGGALSLYTELDDNSGDVDLAIF